MDDAEQRRHRNDAVHDELKAKHGHKRHSHEARLAATPQHNSLHSHSHNNAFHLFINITYYTQVVVVEPHNESDPWLTVATEQAASH